VGAPSYYFVSSDSGGQTYAIWKGEAVLQDPRLPKHFLHPNVIRRLVDLGRRLSDTEERILNFHVRVGTVGDGCTLEQF
jgi:hypothetical protein